MTAAPTAAPVAPAARANPVRTWITIGTLAASAVGTVQKIRRANGSPHAIDHVDLIGSLITLGVLTVRYRREVKAASA